MLFGRNKRKNSALEKEVSGILFRNPVGSPQPWSSTSFIVATPPKDNVINWISDIRNRYKGKAVIVDISLDIQRNFSLSYDFADIIIINPDGSSGITAMDISDTTSMLDSLLSLRLCYEKYTPVYLNISSAVTPQELDTLLSYSRLSGIDGIVTNGLEILGAIIEKTQGRMPVIGRTDTSETALKMLSAGAALVSIDAGLIPVKKTVKILEES